MIILVADNLETLAPADDLGIAMSFNDLYCESLEELWTDTWCSWSGFVDNNGGSSNDLPTDIHTDS